MPVAGNSDWDVPVEVTTAEPGHAGVLPTAAGVGIACAESAWIYVGLMPLGCFENEAFDYKLTLWEACWCPFLVAFSSWNLYIYIKYFKKEKLKKKTKQTQISVQQHLSFEKFLKGIFQLLILCEVF